MARCKNLIGQEFGRWTVIEYAGKDKHGSILWKCKCNCGMEKTVRSSNLI